VENLFFYEHFQMFYSNLSHVHYRIVLIPRTQTRLLPVVYVHSFTLAFDL